MLNLPRPVIPGNLPPPITVQTGTPVMSTLNGIRQTEIRGINPMAQFQVAAPIPPQTCPQFVLPPPQFPPITVPPPQTFQQPLVLPPPQFPPINVPPPQPVQMFQQPLVAPPPVQPKIQAPAPIYAQALQPLGQFQTPKAEVIESIPIALFQTRLTPIPLGEAPTIVPTGPQVQVMEGVHNIEVLGMQAIDASRLTDKRTAQGNAYTTQEMKIIAKGLGLPATGTKADLYARIMAKLRERGKV